MSMTQHDNIDPIEFASRDEIEALQFSRMKWTLTHAYENVPMYRKNSMLRAYTLTILNSLVTSKNFPIPLSKIYVKTTHSTPLPCQWIKLSVFTPLPVRQDALLWSVIPNKILITGQI